MSFRKFCTTVTDTECRVTVKVSSNSSIQKCSFHHCLEFHNIPHFSCKKVTSPQSVSKTVYESLCSTVYEEHCSGSGYKKHCSQVPKQSCKQVPKEVLSSSSSSSSSMIISIMVTMMTMSRCTRATRSASATKSPKSAATKFLNKFRSFGHHYLGQHHHSSSLIKCQKSAAINFSVKVKVFSSLSSLLLQSSWSS